MRFSSATIAKTRILRREVASEPKPNLSTWPGLIIWTGPKSLFALFNVCVKVLWS